MLDILSAYIYINVWRQIIYRINITPHIFKYWQLFASTYFVCAYDFKFSAILTHSIYLYAPRPTDISKSIILLQSMCSQPNFTFNTRQGVTKFNSLGICSKRQKCFVQNHCQMQVSILHFSFKRGKKLIDESIIYYLAQIFTLKI